MSPLIRIFWLQIRASARAKLAQLEDLFEIHLAAGLMACVPLMQASTSGADSVDATSSSGCSVDVSSSVAEDDAMSVAVPVSVPSLDLLPLVHHLQVQTRKVEQSATSSKVARPDPALKSAGQDPTVWNSESDVRLLLAIDQVGVKVGAVVDNSNTRVYICVPLSNKNFTSFHNFIRCYCISTPLSAVSSSLFVFLLCCIANASFHQYLLAPR
jgi:hypothetical protein